MCGIMISMNSIKDLLTSKNLLSGISGNVYSYIHNLKNIKNKTVIDIPCGDGRMSAVFKDLGATVESYDLDSKDNDYIDHRHEFADMNERLPIDSNYADIILCQEGIEHLQDQIFIFSEFNRILKKGGILILTTPSISNLRSKLAYLFMETENFKRLPYNEIDALWRVDKSNDKTKIYFGHLFLITCSKLFTISKINGFRLKENILTKISPSSFFTTAFKVIIGTPTAHHLARREITMAQKLKPIKLVSNESIITSNPIRTKSAAFNISSIRCVSFNPPAIKNLHVNFESSIFNNLM